MIRNVLFGLDDDRAKEITVLMDRTCIPFVG